MVKPEFADNEFAILEIRKRLREAGLKILDAAFICYDKESARRHYAEHVGKGFYQELEDYITSGKAYGVEKCVIMPSGRKTNDYRCRFRRSFV